MTDQHDIIFEYLTEAGSTLSDDFVQDRVWWGDVEEGFDNTRPAIVFDALTQAGLSNSSDVHVSAYQFKCYPGTERDTDAYELYRALYDRLQNVSGAQTVTGTIQIAKEITSSRFADPDVDWPVYQASFLIRTE